MSETLIVTETINISLFKIISILTFIINLIFRVFYLFVNINNTKTQFLYFRYASLIFDFIFISFLTLISLNIDLNMFVNLSGVISFGILSKENLNKQNFIFLSILYSYSLSFLVTSRLIMQISQIFSLYNPISNGNIIKRLNLTICFLMIILNLVLSISESVHSLDIHENSFPFSPFEQSFTQILINIVLYSFTIILFLLSLIRLFINYKRDIPDYVIRKKINDYLFRYTLYIIIFSICYLPSILLGLGPIDDISVRSNYIKFTILISQSYPLLSFLTDYLVIKFYLHKDKNFVNKTGISPKDIEMIQIWKHYEYFIHFNSFSEEFSSLINHEFLCCFMHGVNQIYEEYKYSSSGDIIDDISINKITHDVEYLLYKSNRKKSIKKEKDKTYESLLIPSDRTIKGNITEHFPKVFDSIRKIEDVNIKDISLSFDPDSNASLLKDIKESDGKSGSFFFFSYDKKFILKTITLSELNTISEKFLKSYISYLNVAFDSSIITKIYGIYSITLSNNSCITVILMQNLNVFPSDLIFKVFDLKGSQVDRKTKNLNKADNLKALKDLDFQWINDTYHISDFSKDAKEKILSSLDTDLSLLTELNLMDYSFLLIVVKFPKPDHAGYKSIIDLFGDPKYMSKIVKSKNSEYIYCFGIIDYLQEFNTRKYLENKYKSMLYGEDIKFVSAVDPIYYSRRMKEYLLRSVLVHK